jgi:hypothetical protein
MLQQNLRWPFAAWSVLHVCDARSRMLCSTGACSACKRKHRAPLCGADTAVSLHDYERRRRPSAM